MSNDDYTRGYRDGWRDRGAETNPTIYPTYPTYPPTTSPVFPPTVVMAKCSVCGTIPSSLTGYACPRSGCPYKVVTSQTYVVPGTISS